MSIYKVGEYHLTKKTVYTKHYETAAWYTNIEVEPGFYPVYAVLNGKGEVTSPQKVYVKMPGVIVSDYTYSRILNHYSHHRDDHVGEKTDYTMSVYTWNAAKQFFDGVWHWDPSVTLQMEASTSPDYDDDDDGYTWHCHWDVGFKDTIRELRPLKAKRLYEVTV